MTIGDLIRLLGDGEFHSGEQLGEQFGVSRAAVWKQLRKLESLGISMEAVKGQGYRLAEPLELLDGPRIIAGLSRQARGHLTRLIVEETLPSSNAFLRERFDHGAGHGEVCLVEQQSAGRGRRGRAWNTPWGKSLMLSLGWRVESGIAALEGLSLAAGVALARVLESHGVSPLLKWPNDVLLKRPDGDYGKLAGILVEVSGDASGPCEVVIGMGLNLSLSDAFRGSLGQPAAAVEDQVTGVSRNALAVDLLEALLPLVAEFEREGFAPWRDAWNARHAFAGREVDVLSGNAREVALVEEVDASGNLVVVQGGERRYLAGGEISLRVRS
ncbi:biotin--[acetyl-CoA-carboxylase] ligase [Halomonas sp. KAO]|uniref:biotin--[acetyl-CoA-carboxylase] ligase n=1 Tax=unclassified Halomonas TaxID=2609666 RepID=UPI0018A01201|nr:MULTISPECIES: biotin--[acetyl-CoA-carboxylase] ligase [unclassified Halomonas]MBF7054208.1 biotin--[acetyl-CoA-carboxylase] ligase [Halomonas sp. KAO]MDT0502256.1 biotin--[acetyl-CoA-carboxylase] ligase [Halomonas sp. PAR7]MDT0513328.1 biotin--[acetyl-CoA-carboxylase] ligase [Halomonas sp. LES1]MDT0591906.1 biotin--[acetyl-CoA-carboxylase] ligase [Halomonas sp. PAR8]